MNRAIRVIDSHTGGEPTRLVLEGGPDLGRGPLAERRNIFRDRFDQYRSAIVNEPRGSGPMVGALLVEPHGPDCDFGVIFFNSAGYLGMCGHGTIGVIASLSFTGGLAPGRVRIDTPVGVVQAELGPRGEISVDNVVSYRAATGVIVDVLGHGPVTGDVAWGGNWFFLVSQHDQAIETARVGALTEFAGRIRAALDAAGRSEVDHVELMAPARSVGAHGQNFVLCPGNAYDRSPCGTGTSAKLACLAADGKLAENEVWVQESVIGSRFHGHYRWHDRAKGEIVPTIAGSAFVTGESTLRLDPDDPFCWGIPG